MAKFTNYLDIPEDSSALEKRLLIQENQGELESLFPSIQQDDNVPWKLVKPSPGLCIKTHTTSGAKVFVNICHCEDLPPPDDVTEKELLQVLAEPEGSKLRIPMSIGAAREEPDKSGKPSSVYDVVVNSKFLEKAQKNQLFMSFLQTVVLDGVQDKFSVEFETEYTVLKNRKVMGKVPPHRIQQRGPRPYQPLIQELSGSRPEPAAAPSKPQPSGASPTAPLTPSQFDAAGSRLRYRIFQEPSEGEPQRLVGEFDLHDVSSAREISVDVGEDRVVVECRRREHLVDVFVPFSIDQDKTEALFDISSGMLTLRMPLISAH